MELISKTMLTEEDDWIKIHIWNIQDRRRLIKRKKKRIRKLLFTLKKICNFQPSVNVVATHQQLTLIN